ncbi:MAG: tetratricopeptide repeat protein [Lentisphaeria bacterium]
MTISANYKKYFSFSLTFLFLVGLGSLLPLAGAEEATAADKEQSDGFPSDPGWIKERWFRSDVNLRKQAEELLEKGKYGKAAKVFQKMAERAETTETAKFAREEAAKCFLKDKNFNSAYIAYQQLAREFPLQVSYDEITMQLRRIAAAFASGKASLFGFDNLGKACEVYQTILALAPFSDEAPADMLYLGALQEQDHKDQEAISTYREIMQRFPDSQQSASAQLRLADLLLKRAERVENDRPLAQEVRELCQDFLVEYPEHSGRDKAEELKAGAERILAKRLLGLAQFYTGPVHSRPEAARKYLRQLLEDYGETAVADDARRLLGQLEGETVEVDGEASKEESEQEQSAPEMIAKYRRLPEIAEERGDDSSPEDDADGDTDKDEGESDDEDKRKGEKEEDTSEQTPRDNDKWLRSLDDLAR